MEKIIRIGTRESQLAVWQAKTVAQLLLEQGHQSELVYVRSDGDIDLVTPLYALGVQGVFTRTLDAALLSGQIDIAVHSMKDVPVQLAEGITQAAVLKRASHKDLLVCKNTVEQFLSSGSQRPLVIATSSIRRRSQWLNRYPDAHIENLRGNVNTRLQKVKDNSWDGAIFAAAGLERIGLRPENSMELDWMLPAPAQGAIMVVCKQENAFVQEVCAGLNDADTALCAKIERDFLQALMGGCSTPISALAVMENGTIHFRGNICSLDGTKKIDIEKRLPLQEAGTLGEQAAEAILHKGAAKIVEAIRHAAS